MCHTNLGVRQFLYQQLRSVSTAGGEYKLTRKEAIIDQLVQDKKDGALHTPIERVHHAFIRAGFPSSRILMVLKELEQDRFISIVGDKKPCFEGMLIIYLKKSILNFLRGESVKE